MKKIVCIAILLAVFSQKVSAKPVDDKKVYVDAVNIRSLNYTVEKKGFAKLIDGTEWVDSRFDGVGENGVIVFDDKNTKDVSDDEILLIVVKGNKN